jgi:hypothetical protein
MNRMPYVESLIERWSCEASSRAALEWIRAFFGQYNVSCSGLGETSKTTYAFDDNPAQAMSHENNRPSSSLCFLQLVDHSLVRFSYLCQRPFSTQVGNQVPCVVVDGLTLN